jgi:hypothetical protein
MESRMTEPVPIQTPSGYAPAYAVGFADPSANLILVSDLRPLPVTAMAPPPEPLVGTTSQSQIAGPFPAAANRPIVVNLAGVWQGSVRLLRSTDGGATLNSLRVGGMPWAEYTTSGCEQAWVESEAETSFYLDVSLESGTLDYRVSQ